VSVDDIADAAPNEIKKPTNDGYKRERSKHPEADSDDHRSDENIANGFHREKSISKLRDIARKMNRSAPSKKHQSDSQDKDFHDVCLRLISIMDEL
jgi:hypothetical protein